MWGLGSLVLRYRKWVAGIPAAIATIVLLVILLSARTYTTTVAFASSGNSPNISQLAGLVSRIGLQVPLQGGQTPEFYADLVLTPTFLRQLASHTYTFTDGTDSLSGNLVTILEIDEGTPDKNLHRAVKLLETEILDVGSNLRTGVVTVGVQTEWRALSQLIGARILAQIDEFNVQNRQFMAEAERRFMQTRVDESERELRRAEDALQRFLQSNRTFKDDPRLIFEHDRLDRVVTMRQQIFTTLNEALEQARIEAIRNTPSISLVMPPVRALRPDRRNTLVKLAAALVVGVMFGVFFAFGREATLVETDRLTGSRTEFLALLEETRASLRRRPKQPAH